MPEHLFVSGNNMIMCNIILCTFDTTYSICGATEKNILVISSDISETEGSSIPNKLGSHYFPLKLSCVPFRSSKDPHGRTPLETIELFFGYDGAELGFLCKRERHQIMRFEPAP